MMWLRSVHVAASPGPAPLPWPAAGRACPVVYPVVPGDAAGRARWDALVAAAGGPAGPAIVGTCNGAAGASWAGAFDVAAGVVSGSCLSGLHALGLAARALPTLGEVVVWAVDALSPVNHAHFEALRVVDAGARPFGPDNPGFVPGEAAVALRLAATPPGVPLWAPALGADAAQVLAGLGPRPARALGQGSGPAALDDQEIALLGGRPETPLSDHGHTLGASGALALARAAAGPGPAWVLNRALTGAWGGVRVGDATPAPSAPALAWRSPAPIPPLHHPGLRQLAAEALYRRPAAPPPWLVVLLDAPLEPPPGAALGGRLLPSAIREITPGFAAALLAGCWGYPGPATAVVGVPVGPVEVALDGVCVVRLTAGGPVWA